MTREFNAYEVVKADIHASAISRRLRTVRDCSEKVGYGKAWKASPRTVGFRATQINRWTVELWWRPAPDEDATVAEQAYRAMADHLTGAGFAVARHPGPGHREGNLQVTRKREPTKEEWAALETIAPHPLDCDLHGTTDGIAAEVSTSLYWSDLVTRTSYPLVRHHVWDPQQGFMIALSNDGRKLLEVRIEHERWLRDARRLGLVQPPATSATP